MGEEMIVGRGLDAPTSYVAVAAKMETVAISGAARSGTVRGGAVDPAIHGRTCASGAEGNRVLIRWDGP